MRKVGEYQSFGGVDKLGGILRRRRYRPTLASTPYDIHGALFHDTFLTACRPFNTQ
jgi:hypothetical protein